MGSTATVDPSTQDPVRCPVTRLPGDCDLLEYTLLHGGNPELLPEHSRQWTAGFVWEPAAWASVGVDYWNIRKRAVIDTLNPYLIFGNFDVFGTTNVIRGPADPAFPQLPGPIRHLIVTATGWGLNLPRDAIYLNVTPEHNDGETVYRLHVREVPVDGFWSVSVYDAKGYFEPNPKNAYTLNDRTATKDVDGSVTIQFGGDAAKAPNWLPITPGWNYTVRLYRPRPEVLDGTWTFPEAQPVR